MERVRDLLSKIEKTWCISYMLRSRPVYVLVLEVERFSSKSIFYYPKTGLIKQDYQLNPDDLFELFIDPVISKEDEDNFKKDYTKHLLNGGKVIHEKFHLKASK